jgi:hypothetical protein
MAGLLIKELIARGDLQRCFIVCPGSLAEQWQDELYRRFHLPFEFEGRFRNGVHVSDVSDLMRRVVKENLLKFDSTPLFPERIAYTVAYKLSDAEAHLLIDRQNRVIVRFKSDRMIKYSDVWPEPRVLMEKGAAAPARRASADRDPSTEKRLTAWEVVHQLIRVQESGGEPAAASLVAKLGENAEIARELASRLYTLCERKKRAAEALFYNGLMQSWPEISRLSTDTKDNRSHLIQKELI